MAHARCCLNMEKVIIPCPNQVGCDKDKQELKARASFMKKWPVHMSSQNLSLSTKGVTVQIIHGSVCITVSVHAMFRETGLYCPIKI